MHLKSITLKGFKSFPDRTLLRFGPGVSVIVGPNGSGKSNVTDAVLWAMGEQRPLAVRGQTMQDVIFGGARGVQARSAAEVELVIDNGDGGSDLGFSELSIVRRLDRNGDGEYRLNGARCRLVDVIEALSDTGLGKEMHSVVSQGRVESIVTSKPRDRRLLIEEAAGLGKHRKRRRRAQLKLARTQDNLDRSLDVEREARSRLRPLKRQADAAELHARIERQSLEARWELARDATRSAHATLATAEIRVAAERERLEAVEEDLAGVTGRRDAAEAALAEHSRRREARAQRVFAARSAAERVGLRLDRVRAVESELAERAERRAVQLSVLEEQVAADAQDDGAAARLAELEQALAEVDRERAATIERDVAELREREERSAETAAELAGAADTAREALAACEAACDERRNALREAERGAESARRESARVGAELAAVNQFVRTQATGAPGGARSLADGLEVAEGYELALAAALGRRLRAAIADDLAAAQTLLSAAGDDGGSALVRLAAGSGPGRTKPPHPGAERLADRLRGQSDAVELARGLLADTWVVASLHDVPADFAGSAVTREGELWRASTRELHRAASGGDDRLLAERNRRERLIAASEAAARAEHAALADVERASAAVAAADGDRDTAEAAAREARRRSDAAREEHRRLGQVIEQRRTAPDEGPIALRRGQLQAQLDAERRFADRAERERRERADRIETHRRALSAERALGPAAARLARALEGVADALAARVRDAEADLAADRDAGEQIAAELRACATREAALHADLRRHGDAVTAAEVAAQQARDREAEVQGELRGLASALGLEPEPAAEPLDEGEREALETRIAKLARRRELLGPVNPLAEQEYAEALAHVEDLETQRTDLETALRELRSLIRETDRQIRETFEETFAAAARNFEEVVGDLFPGGRGRLRLVREDPPEQADNGTEASANGTTDAEPADPDDPQDTEEADERVGVEIEITPAGKAMKQLSLLSGGEKSLTALAFLFAVFLARPCPFYILDEVEAALDDLNIDRFLKLLRRFSGRAQFIVVTHQKRTMEAADWLYGVSMGGDGVSKVISRRLATDDAAEPAKPVAAVVR